MSALSIMCIGLGLIVIVDFAFIFGLFGRIGSLKASFQAAGLVFIFMVVAIILILTVGQVTE